MAKGNESEGINAKSLETGNNQLPDEIKTSTLTCYNKDTQRVQIYPASGDLGWRGGEITAVKYFSTRQLKKIQETL